MEKTIEEIIEAGKAKIEVLEQQRLAKEKARAAFYEDQEEKTYELALELVPEALRGYVDVSDETLFIRVPGYADLSHKLNIHTRYVDFGFGEYAYAVDDLELARIKDKGWRIHTWQVYEDDGEWSVAFEDIGDGKRINDLEEAMAVASMVNVDRKDAVELAAQRNEKDRAEKNAVSQPNWKEEYLICPIMTDPTGNYVKQVCIKGKCALWNGDACGLKGAPLNTFYSVGNLSTTLTDDDLNDLAKS